MKLILHLPKSAQHRSEEVKKRKEIPVISILKEREIYGTIFFPDAPIIL